MNYKQHEELLKTRQSEEELDIFKVTSWALEYLPSGLKFLKQYYQGQLDLLAKGYELEGLSFLKKSIKDWKAGLLQVSNGLDIRNKEAIKKGALAIENCTRMLCYSLGDFSVQSELLAEQDDELAIFYEMSSEYSYWIDSDFFFEDEN